MCTDLGIFKHKKNPGRQYIKISYKQQISLERESIGVSLNIHSYKKTLIFKMRYFKVT